jgi:methyl-accepting chemotaxis protein
VASQTQNIAIASDEMAATASDIAQNCHLAAESSKQVSIFSPMGA